MPLAVSRQGVGCETIELIQSDLYSKINSALSNRIGNTLEEIVFVLLRITDYDPIASSPHQFVKAPCCQSARRRSGTRTSKYHLPCRGVPWQAPGGQNEEKASPPDRALRSMRRLRAPSTSG